MESGTKPLLRGKVELPGLAERKKKRERLTPRKKEKCFDFNSDGRKKVMEGKKEELAGFYEKGGGGVSVRRKGERVGSKK